MKKKLEQWDGKIGLLDLVRANNALEEEIHKLEKNAIVYSLQFLKPHLLITYYKVYCIYRSE